MISRYSVRWLCECGQTESIDVLKCRDCKKLRWETIVNYHILDRCTGALSWHGLEADRVIYSDWSKGGESNHASIEA